MVFFLVLGCLVESGVASERVYEEPSVFVAQAFRAAPAAGTFTLSGAVAQKAAQIMGHPYRTARIRYWRLGDRTAWILEEIGKTQPITTGFVVEDGKIESVKVLIYRETHGWEVHRDAFTRQFKGAKLNDGSRPRLSKYINGISGATLSVNALTNLGQLALYLHSQVVGD